MNKSLIAGWQIKKLLTGLILTSCLILASCDSGADVPPSASPEIVAPQNQADPTKEATHDEAILGEPFSLSQGQSIRLNGTELKITFDAVERDGRCPSTIECSESGPVVVLISAAEGAQSSSQFKMNPDPNLAALSGIPPNIVEFNQYEIELTAVNPYPKTEGDPMNLPYIATLVIK